MQETLFIKKSAGLKWVRSFYLIILVFFAGCVWLNALRLGASLESAFLVFLGSILFVRWGGPWVFSETQQHDLWPWGLALGGIMFLGLASGLQFLLALGWCLGLWGWLRGFTHMHSQRQLAQLMMVLLFMFPWVSADGWLLEWYFRLSAASVAESFLQWIGVEAVRSGVHLWVNAFELEVARSCSGLHTLEGTLFFGTLLTYHFLGGRLIYWVALCVLPLLAWACNIIRVSSLCWAAAEWGPTFLTEMLHQWGGLITLALLMLLYVGLLTALRSLFSKTHEF